MMAGDRTYSCTYRTYSAQALSAPPSMSAIVSVTKWSQAAAARCLPFGTKVPAGPDWFHEIKDEGYRLIVQREGKRVRLLTRRGHDWSDRQSRAATAQNLIRIVWTWILRSRSAQTSKRRLAAKRGKRRVAFATPRQEILLRSNAQAIRPNSPRYARSLLSYSTGVPSSFR